MFNISNNGIITLNRGDSISFKAFINAGTELEPIQYFLEADDKLYFAIMEANQPFEFALVRKVFTEADADEMGLINIDLPSTDTECLIPGTYFYEVKLARYDEEDKELIDTIIPKSKFIILD